jgi:hypothetical protein
VVVPIDFDAPRARDTDDQDFHRIIDVRGHSLARAIAGRREPREVRTWPTAVALWYSGIRFSL